MTCDSFTSRIDRARAASSAVVSCAAGRKVRGLARIAVALCAVLFAAGCHLVIPLKVEESFFCDLFEEGACLDRRGDEHVYAVDIPAYKQGSWYDLGYHMYFHTRETPGLRVIFNRNLSGGEMERLEQNLHCSYEIEQGGHVFDGHLEGVRVDAAGAWCFDYLGTMLVRLQKDRGDEDQRPTPDFFPVRLRLKYESADPDLKGEREGRVIVRWHTAPETAEKKGFN